jgi:hypothetical protein
MTIDCELTEEDFIARFEPVLNPVDPSAGFDGWLFETFGEDLAYVPAQDPTWFGPCSTVTASSRSPAGFIS